VFGLLVTSLLLVGFLPTQVFAQRLFYTVLEQVQGIYLAYYGRSGDPAGVDYWVDRQVASGGDASAIIEAFGASAEADDRYAGKSDEEVIDMIYMQLYGRLADGVGKAFYLGKLQSGELTRQSVALDILNGTIGDDIAVVRNKIEASEYFTARIRETGAAYGFDQIPQNEAILAAVTADPATVSEAIGAIHSLLAALSPCTANTAYAMQVLHSSDNESSFQDPNTLEEKILHYATVVEGLRTVAELECIPSLHLTAGDHTLGVLAIASYSPDAFTHDDQMLLGSLAAQAAIALKNAQLFDQVREAEKRLRENQSLLLQTEKLAALGEMSAQVAHEIRNPLSSVGGFARRIRRSMAPDDPNIEPAELIIREIGRLEEILTEQLEFARLSRPRLEMTELPEVVRDTLLLIREEAERRGVEITEEYQERLPRVLLDRDKVKQVLINILKNALGAVVAGNHILVRVDRAASDLRVEIANDGEPMPGEILESLFVPFATTKAGGSGLGLAVAHQIVKEHGGEIHVRTGEPWSVSFTISFPIRENQDRRKNLTERRAGRDRRRSR